MPTLELCPSALGVCAGRRRALAIHNLMKAYAVETIAPPLRDFQQKANCTMARIYPQILWINLCTNGLVMVLKALHKGFSLNWTRNSQSA
jgi:hypothetical protein